MTAFQANICVNLDIFNFLRNFRRGEVLLTTSKGIYLQFPHRILQIAPDSFGVTPIGLGVDCYDAFLTVLSPKTGDLVTVTPEMIRFPKGDLLPHYLTPETSLPPKTLCQRTVTDCAARLVAGCVSRSVAVLAAPLLLNKPMPLDVSPWCHQAQPHLLRLLEALRNDDGPSVISSCVADLLGLGAGLTPSLDDVLLGTLYGMLRLAPQHSSTKYLRSAIQELAPAKTNTISDAYLQAVASGAPFSRLDNILLELGDNVPADITQIMEIGSSSGSEMLLGLLLAVNITTQR